MSRNRNVETQPGPRVWETGRTRGWPGPQGFGAVVTSRTGFREELTRLHRRVSFCVHEVWALPPASLMGVTRPHRREQTGHCPEAGFAGSDLEGVSLGSDVRPETKTYPPLPAPKPCCVPASACPPRGWGCSGTQSRHRGQLAARPPLGRRAPLDCSQAWPPGQTSVTCHPGQVFFFRGSDLVPTHVRLHHLESFPSRERAQLDLLVRCARTRSRCWCVDPVGTP